VIGLLAILGISGLLILAVFSGPGWGPFNVFHRTPPPPAPPSPLTVSAVSLLIGYPQGNSGVLGAPNQSICGQCPVQYTAADPCRSLISLQVPVDVMNRDSSPHQISGVSLGSSPVLGSNASWEATLWNASGVPMVGAYTLSPGASLPFDIMNLTLAGGCGPVQGSIWLSVSLEWN
jgi:hypothetical protein